MINNNQNNHNKRSIHESNIFPPYKSPKLSNNNQINNAYLSLTPVIKNIQQKKQQENNNNVNNLDPDYNMNEIDEDLDLEFENYPLQSPFNDKPNNNNQVYNSFYNTFQNNNQNMNSNDDIDYDNIIIVNEDDDEISSEIDVINTITTPTNIITPIVTNNIENSLRLPNKNLRLSPLPSFTPKPPLLPIINSSNSNTTFFNNKTPISFSSTLRKPTNSTSPTSNILPFITPNSIKTTPTSTNIPKTPKTPNNSNGCIISITENRNREIGYSSYNPLSGDIEVGQFCDTQTYVHMYTKLFLLKASMIIIPPMLDSELVKMVSLRFTNTKIMTVPRKLFNENQGSVLIEKYCLSDKFIGLEKYCNSKYLLHSSFSALIKYLEGTLDINFINNCVRIKYSGSERTMLIDAETIKNLELVHNLLDGSRKNTLLDAINHTKTSQGERLLISNIVQPPNDIVTIRLRQDAIKEILKNEKLFFSLVPYLSKIPDIDKILVTFTQTNNKKTTLKQVESHIKNLCQMKQILDILPKLSKTIGQFNNPLLKAINQNLQNNCIGDLIKETSKYINDKPLPSQTYGKQLSVKHKLVHSIRSGINGLLDVCMKTYKESLNDINTLTKFYQSKYKLSDQLKLQYTATRGYFYQLPCKNKSLFHLPDIFTRDEIKNHKCTFVSDELVQLSRRNKEVFDEIITLSSNCIESLIKIYQTNISTLYNISESISLLDLLLSNSTYVTILDTSICPDVYKKGPLAIKKGYHPLQLKKSKGNSTTFIPNDTMICETSNFQILHGPNMSGKSTYIQQVALLSIMAHIGSYLPAEFASIPILDKIISRIGTNDNLLSNASTFMTEMKEISYTLESCTENSLVIVDELGRGTSNLDGSSIAFAIGEKMADIGCFSLFVTHYQELLSLPLLYPNIKTYHLMVSRENDELKYTYTLNEGISDQHRYGIDIAELAGIEQKLIQSARLVRNILESNSNTNINSNSISNNNLNNTIISNQHPMKNAYQLIQKLLNLEHSKQPEPILKEYIQKLKSTYVFSNNQL